MEYLVTYAQNKYHCPQLLGCFIFLSIMSCVLLLCALTFTPPPAAKTPASRPASVASAASEQQPGLLETFIHVANWRNPRYSAPTNHSGPPGHVTAVLPSDWPGS